MSNKTEYWINQEIKLENWFNTNNFSNFFGNDVIQGDMCVDKCGWLNDELLYLENNIDDLLLEKIMKIQLLISEIKENDNKN